jgi:hypothetical protein
VDRMSEDDMELRTYRRKRKQYTGKKILRSVQALRRLTWKVINCCCVNPLKPKERDRRESVCVGGGGGVAVGPTLV